MQVRIGVQGEALQEGAPGLLSGRRPKLHLRPAQPLLQGMRLVRLQPVLGPLRRAPLFSNSRSTRCRTPFSTFSTSACVGGGNGSKRTPPSHGTKTPSGTKQHPAAWPGCPSPPSGRLRPSRLPLLGRMCPQCAPPAGMRTGRDGTKRDRAAERTDERSRLEKGSFSALPAGSRWAEASWVARSLGQSTCPGRARSRYPHRSGRRLRNSHQANSLH
jgi:hypothetical protein